MAAESVAPLPVSWMGIVVSPPNVSVNSVAVMALALGLAGVILICSSVPPAASVPVKTKAAPARLVPPLSMYVVVAWPTTSSSKPSV